MLGSPDTAYSLCHYRLTSEIRTPTISGVYAARTVALRGNSVSNCGARSIRYGTYATIVRSSTVHGAEITRNDTSDSVLFMNRCGTSGGTCIPSPGLSCTE